MRILSTGYIVQIDCVCPACDGFYYGKILSGYAYGCEYCNEGIVDEEQAREICYELELTEFKYKVVI